jgi:catechol 2,3-dioxygenase-like lactoylglutathione lyase family enzyme
MLDHVSIPVADVAAATAFYDAVLPTVGLRRHKEFNGGIGYGRPSERAPAFWILEKGESGAATPGIGLHISFVAPDKSSVDAFYAAAIAHGAKDAGQPGDRPEYKLPYYGAFVLDLDGFKIEAVCRE